MVVITVIPPGIIEVQSNLLEPALTGVLIPRRQIPAQAVALLAKGEVSLALYAVRHIVVGY